MFNINTDQYLLFDRLKRVSLCLKIVSSALKLSSASWISACLRLVRNLAGVWTLSSNSSEETSYKRKRQTEAMHIKAGQYTNTW